LAREIFGPVLAVLTFDDVEQGVALANNTIYACRRIWTKDIQKAHRAAKAIRAGTVWINSYNFYDSGAPFGGFKARALVVTSAAKRSTAISKRRPSGSRYDA